MYASHLHTALPKVRETIHEAALAASRDPAEIRLIAVTKSHPIEACLAALDEGLVDLGENRPEELAWKSEELADRNVRWHMIGHVQSRKASMVASHADLVHSVDTLKLAGRLGRAAESHPSGVVDVLFQVNTSGEEAKHGFSASEAVEEILQMSELAGIRGQGLMTMAPFVDDESVLRRTFAALRGVLDDVKRHRPDFGSELSMGMTNDLRVAIEEGSTMVRIGTALFGPRPR